METMSQFSPLRTDRINKYTYKLWRLALKKGLMMLAFIIVNNSIYLALLLPFIVIIITTIVSTVATSTVILSYRLGQTGYQPYH